MSETVEKTVGKKVKDEVELKIYETIADNGMSLIEAWLLLIEMTEHIHAEISGGV